MYELLLFNGGVYKFDEFKEFIDDIGGLIIEMESFKINRGMYFLSEERNVLVLVPEKEIEIIESYVKQIKGTVEPIMMENEEIEKVILIFEIHKKLQTIEFMNAEDIASYLLDNPDFINLKKYSLKNIENKNDFSKKVNELLNLMEVMNIIEKFEKDNLIHYRIKT